MKKWPFRALAEVCDLLTDGSHFTPAFVDTGVPFLSVTHVDAAGGLLLDECPRISIEDFETLARNNCQPLPGDVLFSKDGTVGKVAAVSVETPFAVLSSLAILRPRRGVLRQRYLMYALMGESVQTQATSRKSGSAVRRIVLRDLAKVRIPVPPLHEQERIVRLLDEADELRRLRAAADKRMADFIPALFHEMFGDPITNPMGWPVKRLGEVCSVVSGLWTGKKQPYMTVKVVRNTNFRKGGRLSLEDVAEIRVEEMQYERRRLTFGDLILEKSGGGPKQPVGRVAQFNMREGEWSYSNFTSRIRVLDERQLGADVLWSVLNEVYERGQTLGMQTQTTGIKNLNLSAYKRIPVPLPPHSLQQRFSECVSATREIDSRRAASDEQADVFFQSMLHRAFEGEL